MRYHLLTRLPVGAGLMCAVAGLVATALPVAAAYRSAVVDASQSARGDTDSNSSVGLVDLAPEVVRADFAAAIVALHDFWYGEAEARFRAVQRGAPGFTLGYWGEALALHRNPFGFAEPPVDSMRAILARLASTRTARAALASSDHERRYLSALEVLIAESGTPAERHPAYAAAMAALARDHPEDVEALAFHARAILLTAPTFGLAPEVRVRTAEAARAVLALDPDHHGGLHYYVHAMDSPTTAHEALAEADRYQDLATGASHAVHMPSHIYMQLGDWDRVVSGNQAAVRTSERAIQHSGGTGADLDWHAVDFLVYALLQQGRDSAVRAWVERAQEARAQYDAPTLRWYSSLWPARYAAALGRRSDIALPRSGYNSVGEALGHGLYFIEAESRDSATARLEEIRGNSERGVEWRIAALILEAALEGAPSAIPLLEEAIALQSEMPRPNETPDLVVPPEELLGEIQLGLGNAAAALAAFEAGDARWPARVATRVGMARAEVLLGGTAAARERYADLLVQLRQASEGHPVRAEAAAFLESTGGIPADTRLESMPGRAPGTLPEYGRVGTGPVDMVIIPCMSCRWKSFDTFMERNADRYTMHAVTLPGFGGAPLPDLPKYGDRPHWYWNAVDAVSALIEAEDLDDVVLVGHSYGSVVSVGVAARNPARVHSFVNVDGNVMSDRAWFRDDGAARRAQAVSVRENNLPLLAEPEYWRTFNGSSRDDAARRSLYHGMFMATPRDALLQYWRENTLIDLNPLLADLEIPILDLQTIPPGFAAADSLRAAHRDALARNGAPATLHTVFLPSTTHYVMEHRPLVLDALVESFLAGEMPADFDPAANGHLVPEDVARAWVRAFRATLREDADSMVIDALVDLYADDVVYAHPRVGAEIRGRTDMRAGMMRFAGNTRNPSVDLQGLVVSGDDVVLTLAVRMEARQGEAWQGVRRRQSVVLHVENGRITRVTDYW